MVPACISQAISSLHQSQTLAAVLVTQVQKKPESCWTTSATEGSSICPPGCSGSFRQQARFFFSVFRLCMLTPRHQTSIIRTRGQMKQIIPKATTCSTSNNITRPRPGPGMRRPWWPSHPRCASMTGSIATCQPRPVACWCCTSIGLFPGRSTSGRTCPLQAMPSWTPWPPTTACANPLAPHHSLQRQVLVPQQ